MTLSPTLTRALLLGSVGLNLFLLGTLVPGWLHRPPERPPHDRLLVGGPGGPDGPLGIVRRIADDLPPADAEILRGAFDPASDDFRQLMQGMRQELEQLRSIIGREPFDEAALRKALAEATAARTRFETTQQERLATAIARMSPEGRKRMAEWKGPIRMPLRGPGPGGPDMLMLRDGGPGAIPMAPGEGPLPPPPPKG